MIDNQWIMSRLISSATGGAPPALTANLRPLALASQGQSHSLKPDPLPTSTPGPPPSTLFQHVPGIAPLPVRGQTLRVPAHITSTPPRSGLNRTGRLAATRDPMTVSHLADNRRWTFSRVADLAPTPPCRSSRRTSRCLGRRRLGFLLKPVPAEFVPKVLKPSKKRSCRCSSQNQRST
jgi:hypothetical protein